jgi:hypothetical protein
MQVTKSLQYLAQKFLHFFKCKASWLFDNIQ